MIYDIVVSLIGAPAGSLESTIIYATCAILLVLIVDSIVGLFRLVGRSFGRI